MFKAYLDFIEENYPSYIKRLQPGDKENLEQLFLLLNDVYITISFFDKEEYTTSNFLNLLKEYRVYLSRILLLVPLNDKYLIDALARLLVEKLYRIIYGIHHSHLAESSVRKHERSKMSERLDSFNVKDKDILDNLYTDYSKLIHHTTSTQSDLLNFTQLAKLDANLIQYIIGIVELLNSIYIKNVFTIIVKDGNLDLASTLILEENVQDSFKDVLKGEGFVI
ncbi:hypothetical protein [Paenibacillus sp. FSL W7-1287]|uniref:hypothetical protein n=1 Tax=Paenibacillus sp. FSL W7-1287 TaxID=2954538 RepID=UPI0030F8B684